MANRIKLTPATMEAVCASIRAGCYASVAGLRAGISHYSLYTWLKRGEREEQARAPDDDGPPSIYEAFYLAVEQAKAEARYGAETRVYQTAPLQWLRSGYARNDWRESDQMVRQIEDVVEAKLAELEHQREQAPGLGLAQQESGVGHGPLSEAELAAVLAELGALQHWQHYAQAYGWTPPAQDHAPPAAPITIAGGNGADETAG